MGTSARNAGKQSSIAKITRPSVSAVFPRKRLFNLLDQCLDYPVLFIVSPPGSGKTSLVSSYLDSKKLPCIWYSIDGGDADPAAFFYYMGNAAKSIMPGIRKPLPLFTSEYAHGSAVFSKRYFENLYGRMPHPFILVLDNYQEAPLQSEIHSILSQGLTEIPKGINVLILSRNEPPPLFARMQANNELFVIGWKDIQFSIEEARELIHTKAAKQFKEEILRSIYEKTKGWAAGLVLMLQGIKEHNFELPSMNKLPSKKIFDYFVHEIFRRFSDDTQQFLLKTAFLHSMTTDMAEKLTGMSNAEKILNHLGKNSYFTDIYSNDKTVFQYHPLFRDFLISEAGNVFAADELSLIKRNASVLLEESGQIEDAIHLSRESGSIENLVKLILKWADSLIKQGRYQTLFNWIDTLPKEIFPDNPWLLYWKGVCILPFDPSESRVSFEEAFYMFKELKEASGAFLSLSGIIESIIYGHEGLRPLDAWFPVLDELVKTFKSFPSEEIEANVLCSMVRAISLRRPAYINMKNWVDRIKDIIQTSKDTHLKIKSLINLSCYLYSEGNFQELEIILESLQGYIQRKDIPPLTLITVFWIRTAFFNVMSMYDRCRESITEGLELANKFGIKVMENILLGHGVLCSLKAADFGASKQYLKKMEANLSSVKTWEASFYHYCSAWDAVCRGDLSQGAVHARHCMTLCENTGNPWTLGMANILEAYISFASGDSKKAAGYILKARSIGIKSKNKFTLFICLMTEAYFSLQQKKEVSALDAIRKGMKLGRENGYMNIFICQPGVLESIVTKAVEYGIEGTYAANLIRRNAFMPASAHLANEQWPWPLKIFTLGRFGILKYDKIVQFSGKVQHKPLLLLKLLIAFGGREVSEDRIEDILWPEADGDTAHSAFTTTLSRLRQILGIEQAVKFREGKVSLNNRYCCLDVWVFERIIEKIDALWKEGSTGSDMAEAVQLAERAIKMYTGPFLSEENEPWMISLRERLRNKFIRNVKRIGYYWEYAGRPDKAVEYYQKGLEVDDLAEEFYQRIMKCYQKMGKSSEALSIYKRCYRILSAVLGIEPSSETEAIYHSLKH